MPECLLPATDMLTVQIEHGNGKFTVWVSVTMRITLKDGTFHEDLGSGKAEHRCRALAISFAKKIAVSDARKRALRVFGDSLGNCLADKQHTHRLSSTQRVRTVIERRFGSANSAQGPN